MQGQSPHVVSAHRKDSTGSYHAYRQDQPMTAIPVSYTHLHRQDLVTAIFTLYGGFQCFGVLGTQLEDVTDFDTTFEPI